MSQRPTPLSLHELQDAQETSQRPRTANASAGAAFGTATAATAASSPSATVSPVMALSSAALRGGRGAGSAGLGSRGEIWSRGVAGSPPGTSGALGGAPILLPSPQHAAAGERPIPAPPLRSAAAAPAVSVASASRGASGIGTPPIAASPSSANQQQQQQQQRMLSGTAGSLPSMTPEGLLMMSDSGQGTHPDDVIVDDSAWGPDYAVIGQQQQQQGGGRGIGTAGDSASYAGGGGDAPIAEPQLRSLPAPYVVPFPGHREVRLDVQTMRVRLVQRGIVDVGDVGGMHVREGASSALSIASETRPMSGSHGVQIVSMQRPPSGGATAQKFRLCVWKYMPRPGSSSSGGALDDSSRGGSASGAGARPGSSSRWVPTPTLPSSPEAEQQQEKRRPPASAPRHPKQQQQQQRAPAFVKLHRDVVHMSLSFLSTGDLAICSQVCAAWFLLADPWVFLEHYGWVPLGPLSRARRVGLRLCQADDGVLPDVFQALSLSCEHLAVECAGGVPLCSRDQLPFMRNLKSIELRRPNVHDIGNVVASICVPLTTPLADRDKQPNAAARLHCLTVNRAVVAAPQCNTFVAPLLALRAARLVLRRTVTLLPSAMRLLSGSARFPQVVLDRCIVLPTTEAPTYGPDDEDQDEPQLVVSGVVEAASARASAPANAAALAAPCELPCCNFFVDSDLRPIRTPVAQMSRRRLYRVLVSRGNLSMTTSDDEQQQTGSWMTTPPSSSYSATPPGSASESLPSRPPTDGGIAAAAAAGGGATSSTAMMMTFQQQQQQIPKSLCLQCLIWEKPCFRHAS